MKELEMGGGRSKKTQESLGRWKMWLKKQRDIVKYS